MNAIALQQTLLQRAPRAFAATQTLCEPRRRLRVVISPPFGQRLCWLHGTLSTAFPRLDFVWELGSVTPLPRAGLVQQVVSTVRPHRQTGGWVNAIGLRNRGMDWAITQLLPSIDEDIPTRLSLAMTSREDWDLLLAYALRREKRAVLIRQPLTINLSCPNASHASGETVVSSLGHFLRALGPSADVMVKVPPTMRRDQLKDLLRIGIRSFHACNTLPPDVAGTSGALSGPALVPYTLFMLAQLHYAALEVGVPREEIYVVAGGGVYARETAAAYIRQGADEVSIASIWMSPIRTYKLLRDLNNNSL